MNLKIFPSLNQGSVHVPPSKSLAHRSLIAASLATGKSTIINLELSDDILATMEALKSLGASIYLENGQYMVEGISDFSKLNNRIIDCKESGSTLRFLLPLFSLTNEEITFTGKNRLLQRPQIIYETIFKENNHFYFHNQEKIVIKGSLPAREYCIAGNISSQFISGLLFALPLLKNDSMITILPPVESRSYIDLTIQVLKSFGIQIYFDGNKLLIPGRQKYMATTYQVEGDYSQFAFFAALGVINQKITCLGLTHESLQGDRIIVDILKKWSCKIEPIENGYMVAPSIIYGKDVDLANCPDLGPILCVLASFSKTPVTLYNALRLSYKESDRIQAITSELASLGVNIHASKDRITIEPETIFSSITRLTPSHDHRIFMSLAILATTLKKYVIINQAECVNKSYPNFFNDLKNLGIQFELN